MVFVRLENVDELVTLRLWEAGTLGVTEGDGYVDAFFEDAEAASQFGVPEAVIDVDWVARTEESFPPLLVGEKFFVAAPWRTEPTPPGRMRLVINPGAQCGTGYHRCTQLCLEAMEKLIRPGDSVLDVGSGSGILVTRRKAAGSGTRRLLRYRSGGGSVRSPSLSEAWTRCDRALSTWWSPTSMKM